MLAMLPGFILLPLSVALTLLNTAFHCLWIVGFSLIKLLLPLTPVRRRMDRLNDGCMTLWLLGNSLILGLINRIEWQIEDQTRLDRNGWYLLICNHLSWTDIVILGHLFRRRLPVPKFFVKHEMRYVPFVGLACWGLNMPFMRRYSRQHLLRHPHLRGKDVETARRACNGFRHRPTTIINFVEGSRFTPAKQQALDSPYRHLLPPRPAGMAMTLSAMGEQLSHIVNVTLAYPDNAERPFLDLLCGRMGRIQVHIETLPVTAELRGDYRNDALFKRHFQQWLDRLWQAKDERLARLAAADEPAEPIRAT